MENFNQTPTPTLKEKYVAISDREGFLKISDFAIKELQRQSKSIAAFLDGDEGSAPEYNLGEGLRYKGSSGNYSDMKIHIDDL